MMKTRFVSLDDLIERTGVRHGELITLAAIGALNGFGHDRRTALWQVERAVKKEGKLLKKIERTTQEMEDGDAETSSPLPGMTLSERVETDYAGSGLTPGPHPMSFRRRELAMRGVMRARDLSHGRNGRRLRVAGAVITRQRPRTAKGFVFLTLEDETGLVNIVVSPQVFSSEKRAILEGAFLLVEGQLQLLGGVVSVKACRCYGLWTSGPDVESHDFY